MITLKLKYYICNRTSQYNTIQCVQYIYIYIGVVVCIWWFACSAILNLKSREIFNQREYCGCHFWFLFCWTMLVAIVGANWPGMTHLNYILSAHLLHLGAGRLGIFFFDLFQIVTFVKMAHRNGHRLDVVRTETTMKCFGPRLFWKMV